MTMILINYLGLPEHPGLACYFSFFVFFLFFFPRQGHSAPLFSQTVEVLMYLGSFLQLILCEHSK